MKLKLMKIALCLGSNGPLIWPESRHGIERWRLANAAVNFLVGC